MGILTLELEELRKIMEISVILQKNYDKVEPDFRKRCWVQESRHDSLCVSTMQEVSVRPSSSWDYDT